MAAFVKHKQSLDWALGVHIAFTINNTRGIAQHSLEVAKDTQQLEILKNLNPVKMNSNRDGCLPAESQNVFWLPSIPWVYLAHPFFFTRGNEASNPSSVIRTLAYSLAESNPYIGSEICLVMRQHPHIVDASIEDQFQRLLVEPLDRAKDHIHGPIVIILDALDECGNPESRRHLISMISNRFASLPLLRILITSRPDLDIAAAFRDQTSIIKTPLDITKPSSLEDVRRYIDAEMIDIRQMHFSWNLGPTWPGEEKIDALSAFAAGLFIWASTATKYLRKAHDPNDALDHLLRKGSDLDCLFEDSHIGNTAVHDLAGRIATYIPPHLSYSSCFWADHILGAEWDEMILADIENLMYNKFLFWLEILSILGKIGIGIDAIRHVTEVVTQQNVALVEFLADALKFMIAFAPAITHSAPHLYLSALPLTPSESCVAKVFSAWLVRKVDVHSSLGLGDHWPALQTTIKAHDKPVYSVAFSPGDGERIASGSADSTGIASQYVVLPSRLMASESHLGHMTPRDEVNCVAFSPDGERVVSGCNDRNIHLWNSRTGAQIGVLEGHSDIVSSVAFSPNGDQIVSGSKDHTLRVWNAHIEVGVAGSMEAYTAGSQAVGARNSILSPSGQIVCVPPPFEGHDNTIYSVAFSPDGERIVSGSADKTVRSVIFSPNGEWIISGSRDTVVRVWNSQTEKLVAGPFRGHSDLVNSVAFSPDGQRIVSGSADNTICIWDVQVPGVKQVKSEGHSDIVWSVTFSPDGEQIVSGSKDGTVCVWNSQNGNLVTGPIQTTPVYSVAFSPDGAHIASGSTDSTISIWDARTGDLVTRLAGHTKTVSCIVFSPGNGDQIASGSSDNTVRMWDVRTGALVAAPFEGHSKPVRCVAFSPDGEQIVSGSYDTTVRVWDSRTGVLVAGPIQHPKEVYCIAFSPDGERIVSGSEDSNIYVWNSRTGAILFTLPAWHSRPIWYVAFSPDGKRIASGSRDRTVRVWPTQTSFQGHSAAVTSIAFSPDGNRLVSSSVDRTIRIIELNRAPNHPFEEGSSFLDGWILNAQSQLMLWIPPWLRDGLHLPQTSLVISASGTTRLDFTQFVHGKSWEECMDPKFCTN
ncbi:WD40 repeat-like protein [Mycena venus]|uniref:WD40 repeat-like protein n=1 Tax=Mycena venus TaxID=2733690 RepID=A0A8H7D5I0_9AGAR|nr:WD40 repeat-like protein [Mycena venus]